MQPLDLRVVYCTYVRSQMRSSIDDGLISSYLDWVSQRLVRDLGVLTEGDKYPRLITWTDEQIVLCQIRVALQGPCSIHSFWRTWTIVISSSKSRLRQLQSVLNCAARLVFNVLKFSYISAYMRDTFRWLFIEVRFKFRIFLLVWASLIGSAPLFIRELFEMVSTRWSITLKQTSLRH